MAFTMTGFVADKDIRIFRFQRAGSDGLRATCTVSADLSLIRAHGIQLQDLPLLCMALLERLAPDEQLRDIVYTEEEMRDYAAQRLAERDAQAQGRASRKVSRSRGGSEDEFRNPGAMPDTARSVAGGWR